MSKPDTKAAKGENFIEKIIAGEIAGKNTAIHAYDDLLWTVRSGFLTLSFAGWGIIIKAAIDNHTTTPGGIRVYILLFAGFTIALAIGALLIDISYARRKFRVVKALDDFASFILDVDFEALSNGDKLKLSQILMIAGDKDDEHYDNDAYAHERNISLLIYGIAGSMATIFALTACILKL